MKFKPVKHSLLVRAEHIHNSPIDGLPLIGGRPFLDFVNTLYWRLDPARCRDILNSYSSLLLFTHRSGILSNGTVRDLSIQAQRYPLAASHALEKALGFRNALIRIVSALAEHAQDDATPMLQGAIAVFNSAIDEARAKERYSWVEGVLALGIDHSAEGFDRPWLAVVRDAEDALRSTLVSRIRVCAGQGCGWFFLDTSKNGRRRWCSMRLCGNREKARRFLSQHRVAKQY